MFEDASTAWAWRLFFSQRDAKSLPGWPDQPAKTCTVTIVGCVPVASNSRKGKHLSLFGVKGLC